jgi:Type III flagellar switch regulator (C-ring) FliN C-term
MANFNVIRISNCYTITLEELNLSFFLSKLAGYNIQLRLVKKEICFEKSYPWIVILVGGKEEIGLHLSDIAEEEQGIEFYGENLCELAKALKQECEVSDSFSHIDPVFQTEYEIINNEKYKTCRVYTAGNISLNFENIRNSFFYNNSLSYVIGLTLKLLIYKDIDLNPDLKSSSFNFLPRDYQFIGFISNSYRPFNLNMSLTESLNLAFKRSSMNCVKNEIDEMDLVPITIELGDINLSLEDFIKLKKGSVIEVDRPSVISGLAKLGTNVFAEVNLSLDNQNLIINFEKILST